MDFPGEFQVVLQSALLLGRQALEAHPRQRVLADHLFVHGALAHLADPVSSAINAVQRAVYFLQQAQHVLALILA